MPEAGNYKFTFRELAEMMIERAGVTEGLWGIQVNFGIAGINAGENAENLKPAALIPIVDIGLQRFTAKTNLAVDAAEYWKSREEKGSKPTSAARMRRQTANAAPESRGPS